MDLMNAAMIISIAACACSAIYFMPKLGLILIGAMVALDWHFPASPNLLTIAGGIQVKLSDVVILLLIPALLWNIYKGRQQWHTTPATIGALILLLILLTSLLQGILRYGLGTAVNESRPWIYIVVLALWCPIAVTGRRGVQSVEAFFIWTGLAISTVWLVNTAQYGFGGASTYVGTREVFGQTIDVGRATTSGQTIFIAASMLVAINKYRSTRSLAHLVCGALFATVTLLAQHRSVWIAAAVMVAVYVAHNYKSKTGPILCVSFAISLAYLAFQFNVNGGMTGNLTGSARDTRTFEGRLYDWIYTIRELIEAGPSQILLGWNFGRGFTRVREDGLVIDYIPHSWYVGTVLRAGALGLIAGLVWVAGLLRKAYRSSRGPYALPVLAGILVYSVSYNLQWYLTPLVVMAAIYSDYHGDRARSATTHQGRVTDLQHDRRTHILPSRTELP